MGEGKDKSPGRRWVSEKVELARVGKADSASSTLHPHVVQSLSLVQRELQQSYEGYRHRRIRAHCRPLSGVAQELLLMPSSETMAVLCDFSFLLQSHCLIRPKLFHELNSPTSSLLVGN